MTTNTSAGFNIGSLFIDENISKAGVWVDFLGDSKLKISSSSSYVYKALIARLYKENRLRLDDSNSKNMALIQEITCEAMARTLLTDWQNVNWPNADGSVTENVGYTPELGKQALMQADQLRDFVSEQAGKPALFHAEVADAAVENFDGS